MTRPVTSALSEHLFLRGMATEVVELLAGFARWAEFDEGAWLFHEQDAADCFYLICEGTVALKIHPPQAQRSILIQTVGAGHALGWSWLLPPYRWHFDAQALTLVRAIALDAAPLREALDRNPRVAYPIMKRLLEVLAHRLFATRLQLLDLYGVEREGVRT